MSVEWMEPPRRRGSRTDWYSILEEVRQRPGEWARVSTDVNSGLGSQIKKGVLGGAKPGEFEARTSKGDHTDNRYDLYVRYVGEPS